MAAVKKGYFGEFGGRFVPETLMAAVIDLEAQYQAAVRDKVFQQEMARLYRDYIGRPTPLYHARRLSEHVGNHCTIYLKREDLCHTGSHKLNNALGQALLARRMGKTRVIAETGAGQHGVATATAAALLGLECRIYMGKVDMERQQPNVRRMLQLGAQVACVESGTQTLKDAINEGFRDWASSVNTTHYVMGTVFGPHPFPTIVRDFQSIIGREALTQIRRAERRLPNLLVACVGGGSNAMGLFQAFLKFPKVEMVGVEAGGLGIASGKHAARFAAGTPGVMHGAKTYLLQDKHGQILDTHSVSAGLDYAAVGPQHAHLFTLGRVRYAYARDTEVLEAYRLLTRLEGIIPALESSHALAYVLKRVGKMPGRNLVLVNLSGRGDKDVDIVARHQASR